jgi:hypothetical protein
MRSSARRISTRARFSNRPASEKGRLLDRSASAQVAEDRVLSFSTVAERLQIGGTGGGVVGFYREVMGVTEPLAKFRVSNLWKELAAHAYRRGRPSFC